MRTERRLRPKLQNAKPLSSTQVSWRTVALPVEHGGWGFLLEPIMLGLLVAPSVSAALLSLAVTAVFLLRQPAKIIVADIRRGRMFSRTKLAWQFAGLYSVIALITVAAIVRLSGSDWLLPPLLALPFGIVFLSYDLTQPGRTWQAELSAPIALGSAAASMAMLDGWFIGPSLALWAVLAARAVPSILFVRARLRLDRGKAPDHIVPILSHVIAIVLVAELAQIDLLPWLSIIPFGVLLLRAVHGLSSRRWMVSVKIIGFIELGLGIAMVLLVAVGYWL